MLDTLDAVFRESVPPISWRNNWSVSQPPFLVCSSSTYPSILKIHSSKIIRLLSDPLCRDDPSPLPFFSEFRPSSALALIYFSAFGLFSLHNAPWSQFDIFFNQQNTPLRFFVINHYARRSMEEKDETWIIRSQVTFRLESHFHVKTNQTTHPFCIFLAKKTFSKYDEERNWTPNKDYALLLRQLKWWQSLNFVERGKCEKDLVDLTFIQERQKKKIEKHICCKQREALIHAYRFLGLAGWCFCIDGRFCCYSWIWYSPFSKTQTQNTINPPKLFSIFNWFFISSREDGGERSKDACISMVTCLSCCLCSCSAYFSCTVLPFSFFCYFCCLMFPFLVAPLLN